MFDQDDNTIKAGSRNSEKDLHIDSDRGSKDRVFGTLTIEFVHEETNNLPKLTCFRSHPAVLLVLTWSSLLTSCCSST